MSGAEAIHYDVWNQAGLAAPGGAASVGGAAPQPGSDTVVPGAFQFVSVDDPGMRFLDAGDFVPESHPPGPSTAEGGLRVDFVELHAASPGMHAAGGASGADAFLFEIGPQGGTGPEVSVPGAGAPLHAVLDQVSAGMLTEFGTSHRGVGGGAMYPDGQAPGFGASCGDTPFQPVVIAFLGGH